MLQQKEHPQVYLLRIELPNGNKDAASLHTVLLGSEKQSSLNTGQVT